MNMKKKTVSNSTFQVTFKVASPCSSRRAPTHIPHTSLTSSNMLIRSLVFFSNPANEMLRKNMTVRWSSTNGENWQGSLQIWKGPSGYSCLTAIPTNQVNSTMIGLLYEKGHVVYSETISFVRIAV